MHTYMDGGSVSVVLGTRKAPPPRQYDGYTVRKVSVPIIMI
jgi:hypothetical protein